MGIKSLRTVARRLIPFVVRIELIRLAGFPRRWFLARTAARTHLGPADLSRFTHVLAQHRSPLRRAEGWVDPALQAGKEHNVARACQLLDGVVLAPTQSFSYHALMGRPARWRGFVDGLELHGGEPSHGVGGGCCQVSNLLYLLVLRGGMKIVERHRHGLDLFPDHERTVPFGCGATVYYGLADLRFENPLPAPVVLRLRIDDGHLIGELLTEHDPGWTVEIYETDHRFLREGDAWIRENRIHRRFRRADDTLLLDEEVAHNRGRVMYDLPEDA